MLKNWKCIKWMKKESKKKKEESRNENKWIDYMDMNESKCIQINGWKRMNE